MKRLKVKRDPLHQACEAVQELLCSVPNIKVHSAKQQVDLAPNHRVDILIQLTHAEHDYSIVVEVKSQGAPRAVRSAIHTLDSYLWRLYRSGQPEHAHHPIPMLVSPYLSEDSRAICVKSEVAYLDLFGNARLAFGNVYIERAVAEKPKAESRSLRGIFSPRAAAVLRVMLKNPQRPWRVASLAEEANVSLGHVSHVLKALLDREWIERGNDGITLVAPGELLKNWRENYHRPKGLTQVGYTHLHGKQLDRRLSGVLNPLPKQPRAIYSLNSAAKWYAPLLRDGTISLYTDFSAAELVEEKLDVMPATDGANLVLHILHDESLFQDFIEPAPGIFCTGPITTYLDLWNGNERQREAAELIASEFFPWL